MIDSCEKLIRDYNQEITWCCPSNKKPLIDLYFQKVNVWIEKKIEQRMQEEKKRDACQPF